MPVGRPPALTATAAGRADRLLATGQLTQAEVGRVLGCSSRTIRRHVARRRAELEELNRELGIDDDWTEAAKRLATQWPERWGDERLL